MNDMSPASLDFTLRDASATEALAAALARSFPGAAHSGAVMYLRGDLGAGKTTCVRGLLRTLGVTGLVRSPTYTLVEPYRVGDMNFVHIDLYRLQTTLEVDELGLRDYCEPGSLLLIEWPQKGGLALPAADVDIGLQYAGGGRSASVSAQSPLGRVWLDNLGHDTSLSLYVSNLT
jgi:tRNA threonylcarbamoyladenosine biosynthesis protein TsaE